MPSNKFARQPFKLDGNRRFLQGSMPSQAKCSLCHIIKPTSPNHFSDRYIELIGQGRSDVRCKACTSGALRTDLECNDCHETKPITAFSATQRKRGDDAECLSCCNPLAPSSHNIEYDSEKSKVSSKPRVIDVISNRSMSTKASTYAAPSAGTSVIGSDYTSRDGGVRVNSVGSSAPSSSAPSSGGPGSSAQYKSQYLRNSDSDEENDIVAEGYED